MNIHLLTKEIDKISKRAKARHVRLEVRASHAKEIYVDLIARGKKSEKGAGTSVMQELCDFASANKLDIKLHTITLNEKLSHFYKSFGFSPCGQVGSGNLTIHFFKRSYDYCPSTNYELGM